MKKLLLVAFSAVLLAGCAHHQQTGYAGGGGGFGPYYDAGCSRDPYSRDSYLNFGVPYDVGTEFEGDLCGRIVRRPLQEQAPSPAPQRAQVVDPRRPRPRTHEVHRPGTDTGSASARGTMTTGHRDPAPGSQVVPGSGSAGSSNSGPTMQTPSSFGSSAPSAPSAPPAPPPSREAASPPAAAESGTAGKTQ